jgi:RNA polymerase sigma factor for flagellar operon FliA
MLATTTTTRQRRTAQTKARTAHAVPLQQDSTDSQTQLLSEYLPLVQQVAGHIYHRLPRHYIDLDSLVQSGVVGLLEAAQRYDASRGVGFAEYARYRIRGEIMEYLRSLDWASRSVRAWGRRQAAARSRLTARLGREAAPEEMAAELQVSLEAYFRGEQKVNEAAVLNFEEVSSASEEQWHQTQEPSVDHSCQDPLTLLEKKDLIEKLAQAIEALPTQERLVISLSYYEELTLREIGEVLDLTEGRVCQIRTRAITHLRQALEEKVARPLSAASQPTGPLSSRRTPPAAVAQLAASLSTAYSHTLRSAA